MLAISLPLCQERRCFATSLQGRQPPASPWVALAHTRLLRAAEQAETGAIGFAVNKMRIYQQAKCGVGCLALISFLVLFFLNSHHTLTEEETSHHQLPIISRFLEYLVHLQESLVYIQIRSCQSISTSASDIMVDQIFRGAISLQNIQNQLKI